ncbi:MAG: hypothetical protein KAV87_38515 [Desulfobacteraceae bacterium]|nr:hypothetical protein [Desulfobacteraceae bacterium]
MRGIKALITRFVRLVLLAYLVCGVVLVAILWIVSKLPQNIDLIALGQLLVEFFLLPPAIVGFILVMLEFVKSQSKPKLDLMWEYPRGEYKHEIEIDVHTFEMGHPEYGSRTVSLALLNNGEAVTQWFSVEFSLPLELTGSDDPEEQFDYWHKDVGEDSNWQSLIHPDAYRITFMSNGQIASYPRVPLFLGWYEMHPYLDQDRVYSVPFEIATEDQIRSGEIRIKVHVEDDYA